MKKGIWKRVFTSLLAMGAMVGVYFYQVYVNKVGIPEHVYADVVVSAREIPLGAEITIDDLAVTKVDQTKLNVNALSDYELIIGKRALVTIPKAVILADSFFEAKELVLKEGEFVFKVPQEWILSFPNTVRRGDRISFYSVRTNNSNGAVTTKESKKPVADVVIMYAKDASYKEVSSAREATSDGSTSSTVGVVTHLEIIANEDILYALRDGIQKGFRFILTYSSDHKGEAVE